MNAVLKTGLQQLEALIGTRRHTAACLLLALVMLPFLLLFWGMHAWALLSSEALAFYNAPRLQAMQGLLSAAIVFLAWVIAFGWPRRDSERRRARLVLATTLVLGLVLMTLALGYGLKDTPMGLLLLSFLIVARTFFTARELAPAMVAGAALLALNEILLAAGVIPYAPLLAAPAFTGGALAWWWAIWMRVTFDVSIAFFCAALFFLSWVKERRQRALENLTRMDALTGLLNRATFMRMFEEECAKQARNRRPACVLMCDLDFFRRVNDTYGHPAGDLVLMRLGHLLKSATRHPVDLSARYGGEEFVVLLPETSLEAAQRVAARIGEQLRGQIFEVDGQQFSVTISIGIAQAVNGNGDQALRVADENLYRAKHGGRDCVVASRAA